MAYTMKSHSGAKKRFKITASGKVQSKKEGNNHLLTNKGKNNKKSPYGKVVVWAASGRVKSLIQK